MVDVTSIVIGFVAFAMWMGWKAGHKEDTTERDFQRRVRDKKNGRGGHPLIINEKKEELMSRGVVPKISSDPATQEALLDSQLEQTNSDKLHSMSQTAYVPRESGLARTAGQKIWVRENFDHLRGSMWPKMTTRKYD